MARIQRTHWVVERGNTLIRKAIPAVLGLHKGFRAISFFFAGTSVVLWAMVSFGGLPDAVREACQGVPGLNIRLNWAIWGLCWSALGHALDENGFVVTRLRDIASPYEVFVVDHDPKRKTTKILRVAQSSTWQAALSWCLIKFEESHGAVRSKEIRDAVDEWIARATAGEVLEASTQKSSSTPDPNQE